MVRGETRMITFGLPWVALGGQHRLNGGEEGEGRINHVYRGAWLTSHSHDEVHIRWPFRALQCTAQCAFQTHRCHTYMYQRIEWAVA